jgi:hypothetical protein
MADQGAHSMQIPN